MSEMNLTQRDLSAFADLGTSVETVENGFSFVRNGAPIKIEVGDGAYIVSSPENESSIFLNAGSMLASPIFANLERISRNQEIVLSRLEMSGKHVPIQSSLTDITGDTQEFNAALPPWLELDTWLKSQSTTQADGGTDLLLIDGPAGVGKSTMLRETSLMRAKTYDGTAPIILQVESRGRVLQNIADLIAFALQDVRANLTIDQLMSLMRHGRIILAIDGFDELSDPNGFETAWSGLNKLISDARGVATFLLAGRETFISSETMLRHLKSFSEGRDRLSNLTLADPTPSAARAWLLQKPGWSDEILHNDFVEPIFVEGSYALRPFFLEVIAREPTALANNVPPASDLLNYLVDVMTEREAQKFIAQLDPPDVEKITGIYGTYVGRFLEEVARDLAENQADSIAEDALDLLASVAADELIPADQIPAIVQRARTVVFLEKDIQPGHLRFAHEQLLQHFLAREALRSVSSGEIPRYVRRNLFGREALAVFAHVARDREAQAIQFIDAVRAQITKPSRDRTNTNLAVLGVAAACAASPENANLEFNSIGMNELHFPFSTPSGISFKDCTISICHANGVDLSNVNFGRNTFVSTIEIDETTVLPSFSDNLPQAVVKFGKTFRDAADIKELISPLVAKKPASGLEWTDEETELFDRIERFRAFWLTTNIDDSDPQGRKIITHKNWPALYEAMRRLDLLTERTRQASGTESEFIHFRRDMNLSDNRELYSILRAQ